MNNQLRMDESTLQRLRCPICKSNLELVRDTIQCENIACLQNFPVIEGVPVLINESSSIFTIQDFVQKKDTFFITNRGPQLQRAIKGLRRTVIRLLPELGKNIKAKKNYRNFIDHLKKTVPNPKCLVIGGSIVGDGLETILSDCSSQFIESDISFGPRTALICDAHDIPFIDDTFDGVIIQAVFEHLIDPYRCVEEIYRVLNENGMVYAETAFMQQVHGGKFDFTRFTHLGHRRLFRKFEEIDSGAVCGPGMAMASSYQYFLFSFVNSRLSRLLLLILGRLTSFWLKYFDYYLIDKPGALDAASGFYFFGKKSNQILSDKDLLKLYKGLV